MSLTLRPHVYEKTSGLNQFKLVRTIPYIRIGFQGEYYFLQEGKVYDAAGKEMDALPVWLADEVKKLTPEAKAEVGFGKKVS